jgi:transcriptional regulator with XRE-family HTH domain
MTETLAERLRSARERAGLSQSRLARLLGVAPQSISALETGATSTTRYVVQLSALLGVRPEWLQDGSLPMERQETFVISSGIPHRVPQAAEFTPGPTSMPDDRKVFRSIVVQYDEVYLPVFVAQPVLHHRETLREANAVCDTVLRDVQLQTFRGDAGTEADRSLFRHRVINSVETIKPDDLVPRPHYLRGIREAYAIAFQMYYADDEWTSRSILHINPFAAPRPGAPVVIWHRENVVMFGFASSIREREFEFALQLPRSGQWSNILTAYFAPNSLQAVHMVAGLEIGTPNLSHERRWGTRALPTYDSTETC